MSPSARPSFWMSFGLTMITRRPPWMPRPVVLASSKNLDDKSEYGARWLPTRRRSGGMTLLVRLPCALPLSDPHRRSQIQELATAEFATVHFSESVPQPAN